MADWPQQSRLIDVMDNDDGTLSIFSFVTNHASKVGIPDPGKANSFTTSDLGALGRTFSFNDPQSNRHQNSDGEKKDRNVELLIQDPRQSDTLSAQERKQRRHDKQRKHHRDDQDQSGEPEEPGPTP